MKIGFFITARLKSTRLKRKILLDLNGKSVLDRVIERTKQVNGIDGVVLCTSTNPQDSELYKNALSNQIEFYAGSEGDVLQRLLDAAKYYGYDAFLSITADNPLHSIFIANKILEFHSKNKPDFIFTKKLPLGIAPYFINTKALEIAVQMKSDSNTEIWGPFVNRPDFFKIGELLVENSPFHEDKRLTCDYPEDYLLLNKLHKNFDKTDIPHIKDIFNILTVNHKLWDTNIMHKQISVDSETLRNISEKFDLQIEKGLEYAKSIDKKLDPSLVTREIRI